MVVATYEEKGRTSRRSSGRQKETGEAFSATPTAAPRLGGGDDDGGRVLVCETEPPVVDRNDEGERAGVRDPLEVVALDPRSSPRPT